MSLIVNEIFYSIQGESLFAGLPCTFIRLTGCNLRCTYCDTRYAYTEGITMTISQIMDNVAGYPCPLVEITGGEPLFQKDTLRLIDNLVEWDYEVLVETNGTFDISLINNRCKVIVDIKCPSSGESQKNDLKNITRLLEKDQVKFVIENHEDYIFAKDIINLLDSSFPRDRVLLSPVYGKLSPEKLAQWILTDNLNVRLHLQLHKYIWPWRERGV